MAADTAAKRYSAMDVTCPWRGLRVVPDVAIPQGERQAVMFMYSGILAGAPVAPPPGGIDGGSGMSSSGFGGSGVSSEDEGISRY